MTELEKLEARVASLESSQDEILNILERLTKTLIDDCDRGTESLNKLMDIARRAHD